MGSNGVPLQPTAALLPDGAGLSFVWYGDCCSGVPGEANEANFSAVNAIFQSLEVMPDVTFFVGDNILGGEIPEGEFQAQWRYWFDHEMAWFTNLGIRIPLYHVTSNHNTTNEAGEGVFREVHSSIPRNGPEGQEGLSYWVRQDDFLFVFVNTNFSSLEGQGHVEHAWLDEVLAAQADARHKIVIGHHPVFGVNGYDLYPLWRVVPDEGQPFWDVLVRHGVLAYVCSHILAYDVQVHRGVLQVCTGGAGTYGMRLGLMPEPFEYFHLIQGAIDDDGIRYQVLDTGGQARESLRWPEPALEAAAHHPLDPAAPPPAPEPGHHWIARCHLTGRFQESDQEQTLVSGWDSHEGPETIWIGLLPGNRLAVHLVPRPGHGAQHWLGPVLPPHAPFQIEIGIHSGMGAGGVLWRTPGGPWSSLKSTVAYGVEELAWPDAWVVGHGQSGPGDRPFLDQDLCVSFALTTL